METTKHYIKLDENNLVVDAFSSAFRVPDESCICINKNGGRHLRILGETNPPLKKDGLYCYKYINDKVQRASAEDQQGIIDKLAQQSVNAEARAYLTSTDWYVVRQQETGEAIPASVLAGRKAARERIIDVI